MPPSIEDYCNCRTVAGTYENQVLYRMCAEHVGHDDPYISSGKIISIGRIYAASPERGAGRAPANGYTVPKAIAEQLKTGELNDKIQEIGFNERTCDDEVLTKVVNTHTFLVGEIVKAISKWREDNEYGDKPAPRRHASFASKYLHFHRPNAFPIMDSLAKTGLRCAGRSKTFRDYKKFCEEFIGYANEMPEGWTPRGVDSYLVERGRFHDETKENNVCKKCEFTLTRKELVSP